MSKIEFFLPYLPKPRKSPKFRTLKGPGGKGFVSPIKDPDNQSDELQLSSLLREHAPSVPLDGPLRLYCRFQYVWLKRHKPKDRVGELLKDTGADCDNLAKTMCDVMQAMGFFVNDSRIADLRIVKVFTDRPGVWVVLEEATPGKLEG